MISKRLNCSIMLFAFSMAVAGPLVTAASELLEQGPAESHHADGAPCPDSGDQDPCRNDCPCFCCPGHAPAYFASPEQTLADTALAQSCRFEPVGALHPDGFSYQIFRPPRA